MVSYPRFTPTERRKLTMSARARESFRTVGIRGGAGPGEGVPTTVAPYYTLSEEDRATFEHTMNMMHDNDIKKARTAKGAMDQALKGNPVTRGALDALYNVQVPGGIPIGAIGEASRMILCFAGYCTETAWEIPDEPGFCSDEDNQAIGIKSVDIQGDTYNVSGGQARQFKPGAGDETITDEGTSVHYNVDFGGGGCSPVICKNGVVIAEMGNCSKNAGVDISCPGIVSGLDGQFHACTDSAYWLQTLYDSIKAGLEFTPDNACLGEWDLSGTDANYNEGDEITVGFRNPDGSVVCDVLGNGQYDYTPELVDMEPGGGPGLPRTEVPIEDTCKIIDDLGKNPNLQPYLPPPGSPPGTPGPGVPDPGAPPVIPPPIDAPPTQPPDPGTNPTPGQPPIDPGLPPGDPGLPPGDPGLPDPGELPTPDPAPGIDPIGDGIDDPGEGGCMTLSKVPAGFRDPSQPGGIARKYQPGQPITIDYGEGSKCKRKIVKVKPDPAVPEICVDGGIDNSGKTTEKTCYGPGPVTEAIQSVLGEMVAEGGSIIFDSDCTRELRRPLCFRAGTSKRVILNKLLDMCGFCVFPMFDCNVIVGYCGPVNVVWTYHEDVDLIKFDLEYDGQEIYDYVQVCRPDWISRAGNVFVRGNCVLSPVGSPASSPKGERVYEYEVPYGTPDSELNSIAITLAAKLRAQALPEIAFGVPLNSQLAARHQLRIQMPSVGFDAYYMVTRPARDYDRENGHLSVGLARWLRAA